MERPKVHASLEISTAKIEDTSKEYRKSLISKIIDMLASVGASEIKPYRTTEIIPYRTTRRIGNLIFEFVVPSEEYVERIEKLMKKESNENLNNPSLFIAD